MKWRTIISLRELSNEGIERVLEKCSNIHDKDSTFEFEVRDNYLIVDSGTKNQAHKRGTWLTNKIEELEGLNYNVVVMK